MSREPYIFQLIPRLSIVTAKQPEISKDVLVNDLGSEDPVMLERKYAVLEGVVDAAVQIGTCHRDQYVLLAEHDKEQLVFNVVDALSKVTDGKMQALLDKNKLEVARGFGALHYLITSGIGARSKAMLDAGMLKQVTSALEDNLATADQDVLALKALKNFIVEYDKSVQQELRQRYTSAKDKGALSGFSKLDRHNQLRAASEGEMIVKMLEEMEPLERPASITMIGTGDVAKDVLYHAAGSEVEEVKNIRFHLLSGQEQEPDRIERKRLNLRKMQGDYGNVETTGFYDTKQLIEADKIQGEAVILARQPQHGLEALINDQSLASGQTTRIFDATANGAADISDSGVEQINLSAIQKRIYDHPKTQWLKEQSEDIRSMAYAYIGKHIQQEWKSYLEETANLGEEYKKLTPAERAKVHNAENGFASMLTTMAKKYDNLLGKYEFHKAQAGVLAAVAEELQDIKERLSEGEPGNDLTRAFNEITLEYEDQAEQLPSGSAGKKKIDKVVKTLNAISEKGEFNREALFDDLDHQAAELYLKEQERYDHMQNRLQAAQKLQGQIESMLQPDYPDHELAEKSWVDYVKSSDRYNDLTPL